MGYAQEEIKPYHGNGEKKEQVEQMFDNIAHSYDPLNHLLSLGFDKGWRRKAINSLKRFNPDSILDIATGTGDFALLNYRMIHPTKLVGVDISEGMMQVARKKAKDAGLGDAIEFKKGDCAALPFSDASFDAATVAFGVRNFESLDLSLKEISRILKPEGHLVILELSEPKSFPMKQGFWIYSRVILPFLGRLISKDDSAYTYLPRTIHAFPQGELMSEIILKAGFKGVEFKRLTMGVCTLYIAAK